MKGSSESLEHYRVCRQCLEPLYTDDLRVKRHPKCRRQAFLAYLRQQYQENPIFRAKKKAYARNYWHRVMKRLPKVCS